MFFVCNARPSSQAECRRFDPGLAPINQQLTGNPEIKKTLNIALVQLPQPFHLSQFAPGSPRIGGKAVPFFLLSLEGLSGIANCSVSSPHYQMRN